MHYYPSLVTDALQHVVHPGKGKNIVELGMVEDDIRINGNRISFSLLFDRANDPLVAAIKKACVQAIKTYVGEDVEIEGNIYVKVKPREKVVTETPLSGVKNIIAVASGKGGVGKSTVTSNLAVSLAKAGYSVGLLDADIFGPSVPIMFDTMDARPVVEKINNHDCISPVEKYGVKLLSIGYFVNPEDALVWRGAMATNALRQLINDGAWGELDYLLIDLPPGTSDIHLTLVQTVPVTGVVIVTTPQPVALADVVKGVSMFTGKNINVPVLGIVENMAWFTPAELPDHKYYIFGKDGGRDLAAKLNIPLLGQIPVVQGIREGGDNGQPAALNDDTIVGMAFSTLAQQLIAAVEYRNASMEATQIVEIKHK